jgi:hypothetical protein
LLQGKIFLEYTGPVDQKVIDDLLQNLKTTKEYKDLNKTSARRVYAILVECLENISKHTLKDIQDNQFRQPFIIVKDSDDTIVISAGNPIVHEKKDVIVRRLDKVNNMDKDELQLLHEKILNQETRISDNGAGAGLGFIFMKLKSKNHIEYSFTEITSEIYFFELKISVNKYIMRKLIIDPTGNSPRVIMDPENKRFEISGESRPPDVASFYLEILKWFDDYTLYLNRTQETREPVVFNFDFEYFNSSSAKYILDFCKQIGDVRAKGMNFGVKWHYDKDDFDMMQVGQEMSKIAKFPFEFQSKEID